MLALASGTAAGVLSSAVAFTVAQRQMSHAGSQARLANLRPFYMDIYLTDEAKRLRRSLLNDAFETRQERRRAQDELSKRLQRIGVMTYLGAIPPAYPMIMNAFNIIADWVRVQPLVREIRGVAPVPLAGRTYPRRHAEWLALVCYMWTRAASFDGLNEGKVEDLKAFQELYGDALLQREQILFEMDSPHVAPEVQRARQLARSRYASLLKAEASGS